jgi:hypothetical protein
MGNMEKRMVSSFVRFIGPTAAAVSLFAFLGCAGSKSSGADYSSMDAGGGASAKSSAKLEDARRSAEDAEQKAHQLREEKARTQSKSATN